MNSQNDFYKVKKQILFLIIYSVFISLILIFGLFFRIYTDKNQTFNEISVKRINVLENDGTLRMTISNKEMSPAPLSYGKPFGLQGGNRTGIIFFNEEGTEAGGLIFAGKTDTLNNNYEAYGHLSFDQYNQNQVLYLQYSDENGTKKTGLYIDDWQEKPIFAEWNSKFKEIIESSLEETEKEQAIKQLMEPTEGHPAFANRVFIGRDTNKSAILNLCDGQGNTRLQLLVDSLGNAKINFLNSKGEIDYSFPPVN
ncbi:hypothetical protein NHF50_10980 [Flavobacterium sp. NRK F10]|uniref:Uncharacterized protein n=1 Tax=Flavobacterium sediminis TaxID=2201181 RepID=A0A2U8QX32_9FLAO|nr:MULTISPECIES: hypothetical protein [Flavobacterium]AWM14345.1 hypothetical protein DI487_11095 [Flavobacterium sediminis]MCO6175565.1 hypothetical protein [Flavobacterium sp. NRK F10]